MNITKAQEVIRIAHTNATAEAALSEIASRERDRSDMDLRRLRYRMLKKGIEVVSDDLVNTFKEFERIGLGRLDLKKGQPPRFKWSVSLKEVGKAASQGGLKSTAEAIKETPSVRAKPASVRSTVIILPGGRRAIVELPEDVTSEEAKFITENIYSKHRF